MIDRDGIIRMAREAAAKHGRTIKPTDEIVETLTSFAALVAAAEREACVKALKDQRLLLAEDKAKFGGLGIAMCVDAIKTRGKK